MTTTSPTTRILIIEDDYAQAALLRRWLEAEGFIVRHASTGSRGLTMLTEEAKWDLVICDAKLPEMSGLELLSGFKPRSRGVPFLLLSNYRHFEKAVEALRLGATDYLVKPIERHDLVAKVQETLKSVKPTGRRKSVLAVGTAVDEIVQGCGGSLLQHAAKGDSVVVSAVRWPDATDPGHDETLRSRRVAHGIGAELRRIELPDAGDHEEALCEAFSELIDRAEPDTVYVPTRHDDDARARLIHRVLRTCAPAKTTILAYQASRSTVEFRPSTFVDVGESIHRKLELLEGCLDRESGKARRTELALATAVYWSRHGGAGPAEPLEIIRASA